MKHLLDSNTLIEAKNRYYSMSFCPAYWQWILMQNQALEVASISLVAEELGRGNDDLAQWSHDNRDMFLAVDDEATQQAYASIVASIAARAPQMKIGAFEDFLSGADPWLIAKAMATGAVVVTHESYDVNARRKFLIPNVCEEFHVSWINTFELLHKLDARFVLAG
ncbi:DUF4411 family protein [Chitinolyticbacter meiyuanensis]|uniref:DUF4411 family protein n=1 Tax=Chitinolyticbacter meiyuanensis TaxID=682798 RepID=UPI0011E5F644|nr:DUF4411 family protein [Chitinolyticbacter meiyuanensis]